MNNPIESVQALSVLAGRINELYEQSEYMAADILDRGNKMVVERTLLGKALRDAKELVRYGQWYIWLAQHCPKISRWTADRAIQLAERAHMLDLRQCAGLREAYLACGIIERNVPGPESEEKSAAAPEMTIDRIARRVDWFRTRCKIEAVATWSAEQKERMAAALRPMVDFYSKLIPNAG